MKLILKSSREKIEPKNAALLICGDAHNLMQDYEAFLAHTLAGFDVACVGRAVSQIPEVMHWMNVDANEAKWWAEHLPEKNHGKIPIRHTIGEYPWMDVNWLPEGMLWDPSEVLWHGSSALFAVYCGLELGYRKIYLVGCPLDRLGHFYDPSHRVRWTGETYQAWLDFANDPRAARVVSFSGYTKQILGS